MKKNTGDVSGIINRLFIIFLLFTLLVATGSFILRHTINRKLAGLSSQLSRPSAQPGISALLVDLDLAENNFQKASADGSPADLVAYRKRLDTIFSGINRLIDRYRQGGDTSLPQSRQQLAKGLEQKLELSGRLFALRKNFDSLLRVTTFNGIHQRNRPDKLTLPESSHTDTLVSTRKESSRNSLLRRLKEAFHTTQSVKVLTIRQQHKLRAGVFHQDAGKLLAQVNAQYGRLAASGQALVLANLNLLTELRQLINQLQDIDRIAYERSREATLRQYASATADLNTFSGVALVAVLVFILLLLVYVRRAGWAERRLRVAQNSAVKLAGQKSELLAIMSHEIRNKLMAINGAVFTMRRTVLSNEQQQKLATISLSSDLVVETINNVLDAGKLEQGYADIRKAAPFSPGLAISEAVEAMRFMAENKGLTIKLALEGSAHELVTGDNFRLKQVLLNLLSNAIKYTEQGEISVSGKLVPAEANYLLQVAVRDTGPGIPRNQQARLFTAYYQAGGDKPGTGLGLYLCRKLIREQGGEITLDSDAGQGCVFNFSIPYPANSSR